MQDFKTKITESKGIKRAKMWMTNHITSNFQNQYKITNKISDYKGNIDVEIFNSELFDQIALISYKDNGIQEVITQRFSYVQSEIVSMVPYCVATEAKRALICGSVNANIAYMLANVGVSVDMVLNDKEALFALSGFLPNFKETINHENINIYDNFLELDYPKYDIVIHLGAIKAHEFDALQRMTNKDSIIIFRLNNLYLEPSFGLNTLCVARDFGNVLMPFILPSFMCEFYGFLSKTLHPLADLKLQKSDMLENMQFYNSKLHESMFCLPNILKNLVSKYVKN